MTGTGSAVTVGVLFVASLWAGAQNALAGGGSFITLPSLMYSGMDAHAANITSAIALFPAQIASGWTGRDHVSAPEHVRLRALIAVSLGGGALGALLLLLTPGGLFARLVPWLVLLATGIFAWGALRSEGGATRRLSGRGVLVVQGLISLYGGYFSGGIGFLMLATLTAAGLAARSAGATKNVLAAVMGVSTVCVLAFSPQLRWMQAGVAAAGALIGGVLGALALKRARDRPLRVLIIAIGLALTVGLFLRAPR